MRRFGRRPPTRLVGLQQRWPRCREQHSRPAAIPWATHKYWMMFLGALATAEGSLRQRWVNAECSAVHRRDVVEHRIGRSRCGHGRGRRVEPLDGRGRSWELDRWRRARLSPARSDRCRCRRYTAHSAPGANRRDRFPVFAAPRAAETSVLLGGLTPKQVAPPLWDAI